MTSKKHTMHRFAAVAAVLLAFCLVFMMPVGAYSGQGIETDPYLIQNLDDLKQLVTEVNAESNAKKYGNTYFKLTNNIDLNNEEWTPIGKGQRSSSSFTGNSFSGTFDGAGYTISNLKITSGASNDAVGLFGVLDGGTVKNLVLSNVQITLSECKNAGSAIGLMVNSATAENIYVSSGSVSAVDGVGGIVGRMTISGTIKDCINSASVSAGSNAGAGGIVGKAYYTATDKVMTISNCINTGMVTCSYAAGGIVGLSAANVENCMNTGDISAGAEAGGIIGEQVNYGTICGNSNSGDICSTDGSTGTAYGGIIGWVRYQTSTSDYAQSAVITITGNTNTGDVNAPGCNLGSGGIVGNIYNQGIVTENVNSASTVSGGVFASGIVGALQHADNNKVIPATEAGRNITVTNNAVSSTTVVTANTGNKCKHEYAWNNKPENFHVADNLNSVTSYTITSTSSKVSASTSAVKGQVVIITVNAEEGDTLESLSVGETTTVKKVGNLYYFMMPAENVEITAVFEGETEEPVTPPTEDTPESIKPNFDEIISYETNGNEVEVTIPDTTSDNVKQVGDDEKRFVVTDAESGVSMTITFKEVPTTDENQLSGIVESVNVNYVNETETNDESGVTDVTFDLIIYLPSPNIQLPIINPAFYPDKSQQIIDGNEGHTPLAMITASEVADVNDVMDRLLLTFWIKKDEVGDMTGKEFVGYHITNEDVRVITLSEDDIKEVEHTGGTYIEITLKGDSFSTWAVGIAPASEGGDSGNGDDTGSTPSISGSSGSATDTGSGNYQYYPRSVPTDGIISFGTSKVVTGMELPAGSDGTVTLNIKPDFAMPENGYYAFEIDAPGYNTDAKINGGLSFQIPVADLEAAGFTAEDIVLFHGTAGEDGKIVWEALPTNLVKNENGVACYKAVINGCSPFYIGFVKDGSIVNTEVVDPVTPPTETPETPVTPDEPEVLPPADEPQDEPTEEPATPAPILAVLAGLGAVVALRRK